MPKKSINLSLDAIAKVEREAEKQDRNFSNMLERIIQAYFTNGVVIKGEDLLLMTNRNKGEERGY